MRSFVKILLCFSLAFLISCNSPQNTKYSELSINHLIEKNDIERPLVECDSTTYSNVEEKHLSESNYNENYRDFEPMSNNEVVIVNEDTDSIITDIIAFENNVSVQLDSLNLLADSYINYEFVDCVILQEDLYSATDFYFEIINDIELSDTLNINRLIEMESFIEVLSPQIEMLDDNCPDLYNDFMELIEDKTDLYYSKLESVFGSFE